MREPGRKLASLESRSDVFQRDGQIGQAGFVRGGTVSASCICRRRSKAADRGEDGAHHLASDGDLRQMEGDGAGVAQDAGTDPDEPGLKAGWRPVCPDWGSIPTKVRNAT